MPRRAQRTRGPMPAPAKRPRGRPRKAEQDPPPPETPEPEDDDDEPEDDEQQDDADDEQDDDADDDADDDDEPDTKGSDVDDRPSTIEALISTIADEHERYVVQVFRKGKTNGGRPEYLSPRFALSQFSLDAIKERHGGGEYEFRFLKRDARGVERFYRTLQLTIAGPARVEPAEVTHGAFPQPPIAVVPPPHDERISRLESRIDQLVELLYKKANDGPTRAEPNALDMLARVTETVTALTRRSSGMSEFREFMGVLNEFSEMRGSGRERVNGMDRFFDRVAEPMAAALTGGAAANGRRASTHDAPPAGGNEAPAPLAPPPTPAPVSRVPQLPGWLMNVKPYLPAIHSWALAGEDPKAKVQFVVAVVPNAQLEQIAQAAEVPDFPAHTLAMLPEPFRAPNAAEWTLAFLTELQDTLTEPETDAAAEGVTNG